MRPKPGAAAPAELEPAPCRSQTRLQLPGGSLPVNVRDALGRPWLPQIPGLTPGEGGSPHLHNAQSYYVFNLSLPKCVGADPCPLTPHPPPPQPYGPFPDAKGALGIARQQTPPPPPPPHPHPTPDRYRLGVGAFNTNLTMT